MKCFVCTERDGYRGRRMCNVCRHKRRKELYPEKLMWEEAKRRSAEAEVSFDIEVEDIHIPKKCPLLGVILTFGNTHSNKRCSPSLDRKDPAKGYVKGNVWVISNRANTIKNDATPEELRQMAEGIQKHFALDAVLNSCLNEKAA